MSATDLMMGLSNRFKVEVGGISLGSWAKCEGLNVTFGSVPMVEGGQYGHVTFLPDQVKYGNVKLTRAMSAKDSESLRGWLHGKAAEYNDIGGNTAYSDGSATITLFDAQGGHVMTWELRGVHVASWSGPQFDASTSRVAQETLELVHEGFL